MFEFVYFLRYSSLARAQCYKGWYIPDIADSTNIDQYHSTLEIIYNKHMPISF